MGPVVRAKNVVQVVAGVHLKDEHVGPIRHEDLAKGEIRLQRGVASRAVGEDGTRMVVRVERRLEHPSRDLVIWSAQVGL